MKHRLQVLEMEDENLNKSFQHYLKKQTNENRQIQGYCQKIMENLNVEQSVLSNQKLVSTVPPMFFPPKEQEITQINWESKELSIEDESKENGKYENPFRTFKPTIVMQETRSVAEIPIRRTLRDLLSSQSSMMHSKPEVEEKEIPKKSSEVLNPKIDLQTDEKQEEIFKEVTKIVPVAINVDPEPFMVVPDKFEEKMELFRPISPKILIVSPENGAVAFDVTRQVDKRFLSELYDKNSSESEGQIILSTGDKSDSDEFWK